MAASAAESARWAAAGGRIEKGFGIADGAVFPCADPPGVRLVLEIVDVGGNGKNSAQARAEGGFVGLTSSLNQRVFSDFAMSAGVETQRDKASAAENGQARGPEIFSFRA